MSPPGDSTVKPAGDGSATATPGDAPARRVRRGSAAAAPPGDVVRRVSRDVVTTAPPDEPMPARRALSPARRPPSRIVHVRNLVRPFTLGQLQSLLGRTGKAVSGGFWIDKVKSHCYLTVRRRRPARRSPRPGARPSCPVPRRLHALLCPAPHVIHALALPLIPFTLSFTPCCALSLMSFTPSPLPVLCPSPLHPFLCPASHHFTPPSPCPSPLHPSLALLLSPPLTPLPTPHPTTRPTPHPSPHTPPLTPSPPPVAVRDGG